ncbi:hypothetical protein O7543_04405 [Solwaraspora sp. WMMA2080]|uniref:hypothetical protein n=1 Tax=unclassified Solwaraspora TaxID=2627926 RepID=UPI00248BC2CC|nr:MULTISPECIES: hypothetical protein [unclassified Solwaraspora]WBB99726.1 hypothetical protein O7553_12965 [Solwaraspora sp. WMMA2059]WBC21724.1 hypothetical protein O7543_04405 [Solwaraspora sp. WMMA2080]
MSVAAGVALAVVMTSGAAAVPASESDVGAAITTRVFDRATSEPVKGVCVLAMPVPTFSLPNACPARSGGGGRVTVDVPGPGQYNLFALPKLDSPYGAQWVGPDGGTGRQQDARRVTLAAGETKRVAQILLDPRATISGVVDHWAGDPAGLISIAQPELDVHQEPRSVPVDVDGTFDIDWVGPYEWPLLFRPQLDWALWSGQVGNRLLAETVPAVVGGSADRYTFRTLQFRGAAFGVQVSSLPTGQAGRVVFYNSATRDVMGVGEFDGGKNAARARVVGGQQVKVECHCPDGTRWYGGTDFASATPIAVAYYEGINLDMR